MATYLPNITDTPAPIVPFQPDFNFLNLTLTQATQKWELASQQATQIYRAYLEANHINEHVKNMRDEYRKKIDKQLTELAAHNLTDIRVMKSFRELVTGIADNPYYLYDLQITHKYNEVMSSKSMWEKTAPSENTGYKHWDSQIEDGLTKMLTYYRDKELNDKNLPLFSFVFSNILDPVQIDENAYINALGTNQFNKLKTGVQGDYLVGTSVSFAGPSVGGIQPYIVKEVGGDAIRGYMHDIVLKDFKDGNLKRLYEQRSIADVFIQGAKYNYDWGKVVQYYKDNIGSKYDQLQNTIDQMAKYASDTREQAIGYMASNTQAAGVAVNMLNRINAEKNAQTAQVLNDNADKAEGSVTALLNYLEMSRKQESTLKDADFSTALVASKLYNLVSSINNTIVETNKWVDAHAVKDIEYNKAFGDYLDYLAKMADIKSRAALNAQQNGYFFGTGNRISKIENNQVTGSYPVYNLSGNQKAFETMVSNMIKNGLIVRPNSNYDNNIASTLNDADNITTPQPRVVVKPSSIADTLGGKKLYDIYYSPGSKSITQGITKTQFSYVGSASKDVLEKLGIFVESENTESGYNFLSTVFPYQTHF